MTTAKIAALYQASNYAAFHKYLDVTPSFGTLEELAYRVRRLAYSDDIDFMGLDAWRYHLRITDGVKRPASALDFFGDRQFGLVDTYCPRRVYDWAAQQLAATAENEQAAERYLVALNAHAPRNFPDRLEESVFHRHIAGVADFATLERGIVAYQRKRQQYAKKIQAQLAVYHQQQLAAAQAEELRNLRRGYWLGADKALTTAARVDEPGVPFCGDVDAALLPTTYSPWVVPADAGMSAAFPTGTGLFMQQVTDSRKLVDGAVYLWGCDWGPNMPATLILGRLDLSAKQRGFVPLRSDDTGKVPPYLYADWTSSRVKIWRVTHYTTRAATPAAQPAPMQAETQPARPQPAKRKQKRELALAA